MSETPTSEQRTLARPGQHSWQQWPLDLTVEYGPVHLGTETAGFTAKTYRVYLNGEHIGEVALHRETTYKHFTKGILAGLRQQTGHANKWRFRAVRGTAGRGIPPRYTSRAEAAAALIKFHTADAHT